MVRRSCKSSVSHASALQQVTCEMFISKAFQRPCGKNYISGYTWHKSFIQTVKCFFFNQTVVYQSFYGALLTFSYFLLTCWQDFSFEDLVEKVISGCIWQESFIQMVNYSFPSFKTGRRFCPVQDESSYVLKCISPLKRKNCAKPPLRF